MFAWQHAGQQQIRRLYIGAPADANEAPIDADPSSIDADITIHADASSIDADITIHADASSIDTDIIHTDESPTDVTILEKNEHLVHLDAL